MDKMFKVEVWQRISYLVRGSSASDVKAKVLKPVERIGTVGLGNISESSDSVKVTEATLQDIEAAEACSQEAVKA